MTAVLQAGMLSRSSQAQRNEVHDYSNGFLHDPSDAPRDRASKESSAEEDFQRQMDDERQRNKSSTLDRPLPRQSSRKVLQPKRSVNPRQSAIGNMTAISGEPSPPSDDDDQRTDTPHSLGCPYIETYASESAWAVRKV